MIKKAFKFKGKYLEPVVGAGIGAGYAHIDPDTEKTLQGYGTRTAAGAAGLSLLGRSSANTGMASKIYKDSPRPTMSTYYKNLLKERRGATDVDQIKNLRADAIEAIKVNPSKAFPSIMENTYYNAIRPIYNDSLSKAYVPIRDSFMGLDFAGKGMPIYQAKRSSLDAAARRGTMYNDLNSA